MTILLINLSLERDDFLEYSKLFSEGKIGNVTIKNRVVMSPMVMDVAAIDGTPNEQMMAYYEERAKGGVGLIITEATRVDDSTGLLAPRQLGMSRDKHIEPFAKMVSRIHRHGTKIFCQLHHPGRQSYSILIGTWNISQAIGSRWNGYWDLFFGLAQYNKQLEKTGLLLPVVAPSAVPCRHQNQKTRALRVSEIKKIISEFGDAAKRVKLAGGDGVELHGAHGYLIQQFLSPHTNKRTDEYGGSFENRMRFVSEIIADIKAKCGEDFPIIVRLSVEEFYSKLGDPDEGITLPEGIKIAKELEKLGVAALDISSGSYEAMNYWLEPVEFDVGWRKYLAKAVKESVSIPVLAANLIRSPEQAEQQIEEGTQDFVSLGRPLLADPDWANKAKEGRTKEIKRCICCLWCFESMLTNAFYGVPGQCAVNPRTAREVGVPKDPPKDGAGRTVAIIGAGPAGLMAAETLGRRGFKPVVFEKEKFIGGQLQLANKPPHKEKISWCYEDLETAARKYGAKILLDTPATVEKLKEINPYAVFVATGAKAIRPRIEGADGKNVCTVTEILDGTIKPEKKKIAVIGSGMTGLETADMLAENGNDVIIVEMADTVAPGTYHQHTDNILPKLKERGVQIVTSQKLVKVTDRTIELEDVIDGIKTDFPIDLVVLSVGVRSCNEIVDDIKNNFSNVFVIGDAHKPGRIASATREAFDTARSLK